ncbi:MAG: hypothetical protein AAGF95_09000 [Chloroflexota bacterium]
MYQRFVTNFDITARALLYDPHTGTYQEMMQQQIPTGVKRGLGFYVNVVDTVVGVYTTSDGLVCFHNQQRYPLVLGEWDVTVTSADEYDITQGRNIFTLVHEGQQAFTLTYEAPRPRYYDAWSATDEDVNFFLWLKVNVNDQRFHTFYTQEWNIGADDL